MLAISEPTKSKKSLARKSFKDFSKRELQDFLGVLHCAVDAATSEDVGRALELTRHLVPGQRIIAGLIHVDPVMSRHTFVKIINISYHSDWINRYLKSNYAEIDPVLLAHTATFQTQVWANSFKRAQCKEEKEFIEEAKSYDLSNGVTAGTFDAQQNIGSFFSFAGGTTHDNQHYAGVLECLAHSLHHTLMKDMPVSEPRFVKGLSPRELSVLGWMKNGKTNWEISRILGVSERTVRFHVESIFNKLDVSSRTQAVAMAMEHGLLMASLAS